MKEEREHLIKEYAHFLKLRGLLPLSIKAYTSDISLYLRFCQKFSCSWEKENSIFRYLSYLAFHKAKGSTIERKRAALIEFSLLYKSSNGEELFSKNKLKSPKKGTYLPNIYETLEIKALLDSFDLSQPWEMRDACLILFLFGTGLRASELLHVKLQEIKENGQVVVLGKGNKERVVFIPLSVLKLFKTYVQMFKNDILEYNALFFSKNREPLTYSGLHYIITHLYRKKPQLKSNKHLHPHGFRHSFATALLENGADIRKIGELLGHSSLDSTQRYTHVNKKLLTQTMSQFHPHFH